VYGLYAYLYKVVTIYSSCSVSENMPLYDILNEFQKGHSHIAVVYKDLNGKNEAPKRVKDGEQQDLRDNYKNKGENAPLDKGRDLNKSRINFSFFVEHVLSKYYVWFAIC